MFVDQWPKTNEKESENPEEKGMIDERRSQNTGKEWVQEHRRVDYPSSGERSVHPLKWKRRQKGWAQSQIHF